MATSLIGIGLRYQHYQQILQDKPDIDWLEVHSESYLGEGGGLVSLLSHKYADVLLLSMHWYRSITWFSYWY